MAKTNVSRKSTPIHTHEGAKAHRINPKQQLRRSVMSCMLWESEFYEDGESIAQRISEGVANNKAKDVFDMAVEAREKMKLRHVPLLLAREMSRHATHKSLVASLLERIIQRADELSEFLSIYWKGKKQPISAQVKKGLARAFSKFNEYQLAKYNRDDAIKLRDVLFLCHAKPKDEEQAALWSRLVNNELETPDTWEVNLSTGKDKKETFERLLREKKLGALALLRNLRNMRDFNVDENLIFSSLESMNTERVLPFRFISAARYAPQWEDKIEVAMLKCLEGREKLSGKTALVIDGSGSMFGAKVSAKSDIDRFDAACALAILVREICEHCSIVVFSNNAFTVPPRRGFALRDAIRKKAEAGGTHTQRGIDEAASQEYDRIIIITDEQSHTSIRNPIRDSKGYVVNVASYQNGIGYGEWTHIDGWSEAILDYIMLSEKESK